MRQDNSVEREEKYGQENLPEIIEPFNPKDVDIVSQTMVISNIIDRLKYGALILNPDFQRKRDLWDEVKQSRLIESMIIRVPLPSFYFDVGVDEIYNVVEGLQRLNAILRFIVLDREDNERLRLTGLEYLDEFNGCYYEDLPINIQRRIREQEITAYVIRPGTPERVKVSIFTRINTGGMVLEQAEIRNSVYRGQAASFLRKLADSVEFKKATRNKIPTERMEDCEFVNRFLAFYILGIEQYQGNLEDFFCKALEVIQTDSEIVLEQYENEFRSAMVLSKELFGDAAFRKPKASGGFGQINRPLFECVSVTFAKMNHAERDELRGKRDLFVKEFYRLLDDPVFLKSITNGTGRVQSVKTRHREMEQLLRGVLE